MSAIDPPQERELGFGLAQDEHFQEVAESDLAVIEEVLENVRQGPGALGAALARLQELLGCVSPQTQEMVARRLGVPQVRVQEVVSFDPDLSPRRRAGESRWCGGAACLASPGLAGPRAQSTGQGVASVACLGACWGASVAEVGSTRCERLIPSPAMELSVFSLSDRPRHGRPGLRGAPTAPWGREALSQIRLRVGERLHNRAAGEGKGPTAELLVCNGSACSREAADRVAEAVSRSLAERNLDRRVRVVRVGCRGDDVGAVTIAAMPGGWRVRGVDEGSAAAIVAKLALDPAYVPREALLPGAADRGGAGVLRRCGVVDPLSLEEYIASGGFSALERALSGPEGREWALRRIGESGICLRGCGTPLAQLLGVAPGGTVVLCPCLCTDAYLAVDGLLLGGDPFAVLEGVALAGLLSGARQGILMPPAGAVHLIEEVELAVALTRRRGLLGPSLLGTGVPFDVTVRPAPRALVATEASALRRFVLGEGPLRPPPHSLMEGIPPALILDPESAARLCCVLEIPDGDEEKRRTLASRRLVALVGSTVTPAVLEVERGASLADLLVHGQGEASEVAPTADGALSGGLLGVFIRGSSAGTGVAERGSALLIDEKTCVVALVADMLTTLAAEACGGCASGRGGVRVLREAFVAMAKGEADGEILASVNETAAHLETTARCGLGRGAGRMVKSALAEFGDAVAAHLAKGYCGRVACSGLAGRS